MEHALVFALLLIAVGLILLVADLFLPTFGVLMALGICAIIVGVWMTFYHGDPTTGFLTLLGVFISVPLVLGLAYHIWRRSPMSRKMILPSGADDDATVAQMPVHLELEQLRGRFGRAVSPLRPAGIVDFDGRRIDTITEGMMVEPGTWVRCIDVKAGKVIVRPTDAPKLDDLENIDIA
jgi:membrane-bound serine protease (ClpP class)